MSSPRIKAVYLKSPRSLAVSPKVGTIRKKLQVTLAQANTKGKVRRIALQSPQLRSVIRRLEGRIVYRRLISAMN